MRALKFFVGIDISKLTADVAVLCKKELVLQTQVKNNEAELMGLFSKFRTDFKCCKANTCICVENMGIYNTFLYSAVKRKKLNLYLESPLEIKRSLGLQRGKNDALDALRIATYAAGHFNSLKKWEPARPAIEQLRILARIRTRLKKAKMLMKNPDKLTRYYFSASKARMLKRYIEATIKSLDNDVRRLEKDMDNIVESDPRLRRLMELIISVPRISKVIARELIIHTNEFKQFTSPRAFACYCGIVPFQWTSGSEVKGKTRISYFGNREMKALLHIAGMGIIKDKKSFLYDFYQRKVGEGKNKMAVLNALRNKLVHRIFACVRNNEVFVEIKQIEHVGRTNTFTMATAG